MAMDVIITESGEHAVLVALTLEELNTIRALLIDEESYEDLKILIKRASIKCRRAVEMAIY